MLDWHYAPTSRRGEVMTDMPFPLYPPGMYQVGPSGCTNTGTRPLCHCMLTACNVPAVASSRNDCSVHHIMLQYEHIESNDMRILRSDADQPKH